MSLGGGIVHDLIRTGICEIVCSDEVEDLIEKLIFKYVKEWRYIQENSMKTLYHRCNQQFSMIVYDSNGTVFFAVTPIT